MLAARGVSLGLGRINLSDLNQLPKADKALLAKLKREQPRPSQESKLVVRKHVDSKTLWIACATVILGAALMVLGLVMTVVGYFDSDLFLSSTASGTRNTNTNNQHHQQAATTTVMINTASSDLPPSFSPISSSSSSSDDGDALLHNQHWFRFLLKSMQYVGPVLMGIGMFLLIIACVISLESRDRHAQIIQEECTELHRSRRLQQSAHLTATGLSPAAAVAPTRCRSATTGMTKKRAGDATTEEEGQQQQRQIRENGVAGLRDRSATAIGAEAMNAATMSCTSDAAAAAAALLAPAMQTRDNPKLLVHAEVHYGDDHTNSTTTTTTTTVAPVAVAATTSRAPLIDISLGDETSSTDVMAEYTFPNAKAPQLIGRRKRTIEEKSSKNQEEAEEGQKLENGSKNRESDDWQKQNKLEAEAARQTNQCHIEGGGEQQQQQQRRVGGESREQRETTLLPTTTKQTIDGTNNPLLLLFPANLPSEQRRRKSSSALLTHQQINRHTPRGPAPLVRVESLVELSAASSNGASPSKSFGTPQKRNDAKTAMEVVTAKNNIG